LHTSGNSRANIDNMESKMNQNTSSTDAGSTIFETLKEELLDLRIKPGEEISESELCSRFSVTRPPVRAALRRLSDIGLVEIRPYYGTYATLLDMDKVYQIIHMRILVESKIIQDYIESKPDGFELEELEHNIRLQNILLEQPQVNYTKFYELDNDLHSTWFKKEHSEAIWDIIQAQKIEYTRFRMLDFVVTMQYREMIDDHAELVEAIKKEDSEHIPAIIGRHLNNGLKRMGDKIFTDYQQYITPPKDTAYWTEYNSRY
jgi:GntR family transcriptional regulator, rspAB operon transcriptional repressor